jgi:hypothetical protein
MPILITTIDPRLCEVKSVMVPNTDAGLLDFTRQYIGGDLDHSTIAIYPSGHRLCIWVYEYGLVGGPKATKEYFILNRQLYNGRAVLYTADERGETISTSKALTDHLNRGDCSHLHWCSTANVAEKLITDGKCQRPETTINGAVAWRWSATTSYDKWKSTMEEVSEITLKNLFKNP